MSDNLVFCNVLKHVFVDSPKKSVESLRSASKNFREKRKEELKKKINHLTRSIRCECIRRYFGLRETKKNSKFVGIKGKVTDAIDKVKLCEKVASIRLLRKGVKNVSRMAVASVGSARASSSASHFRAYW